MGALSFETTPLHCREGAGYVLSHKNCTSCSCMSDVGEPKFIEIVDLYPFWHMAVISFLSHLLLFCSKRGLSIELSLNVANLSHMHRLDI